MKELKFRIFTIRRPAITSIRGLRLELVMMLSTLLWHSPHTFAMPSDALHDFIAKTSVQTCEMDLKQFHLQLQRNLVRRFYAPSEASSLIRASMHNRIVMRQKLLGLSLPCDEQLRQIFVELRNQEDYFALNSNLRQQVPSKAVNFKKQPVPLKQSSSQYEKYVTLEGPSSTPFLFKNGDLMITRGISWFSSTIAQSTSNRNHFSHGVLVYKDAKQREYTIESYIGKGVGLYTIEEALKNENARIQVYRLKNHSDLADQAGKAAYENYVLKRKVRYDYDGDFSSDRNLSCVEIPFWAYKKASGGILSVPSRPSILTANARNLLSGMGFKSGPVFAPADIEVDPRFELVAEWTDFRFAKENMIKDVVSEKLLQWTTFLGYRYANNLKAEVIDWPLTKEFLSIFRVLPSELPKSYAVGSTMIFGASEELYNLLTEYYDLQVSKAAQGYQGYYPPTKQNLLDLLEMVRTQDIARRKAGAASVIKRLWAPF